MHVLVFYPLLYQLMVYSGVIVDYCENLVAEIEQICEKKCNGSARVTQSAFWFEKNK